MSTEEKQNEDVGVRRSSLRPPKPKNKFAVLKSLRESGTKHKAEVSDESDKLWMEVSEEEFSRRSLALQQSSFIVDDDGSGYVEDGREIFDEEGSDDDENYHKKSSTKQDPDGKKIDRKSIRNFCVATKSTAEKKVAVNSDAVDTTDLLVQLLETANADYASPEIRQGNHRSFGKREFERPSDRSASTSFHSWSPSQSPAKKVTKNVDSLSSDDFRSARSNGPALIARDILKSEDSFEASKPTQVNSIDNNLSYDQYDMPDDNGCEQLESSTIDMLDKVSILNLLGADENDVGAPESNFEKSEWVASSSANNDEQEDAGCPTVSEDDSDTNALNKISDGNEDENFLKMYWLDAYEDPKHSGSIYLFGKIRNGNSAMNFSSCCIVVKEVERVFHFLPKPKDDSDERIPFDQLYNEICEILQQHKIDKFRCKKVKLKYAFSMTDVPREETEYLQLRYDAKFPQLPHDLVGKTFLHIFGSFTGCLETLLLERQLKGPCWIKVMHPTEHEPKISHCDVEYLALGFSSICALLEETALAIPPLKVVSLDLKIATVNRENQVVAASALFNPRYLLDGQKSKQLFTEHLSILSHPTNAVFPYDVQTAMKRVANNVQICNNEKSLLNLLLSKIQQWDPDVIAVHDFIGRKLGFQLETLMQRLADKKPARWHRLGRLSRALGPPKTNSGKHAVWEIFTGRLLCDVGLAAQELVAKCQSYDLTQIVHEILREERKEPCSAKDVASVYGTSAQLSDFVVIGLNDSKFILKLMLEMNALPLFANITQLVGGVMSRTLLGGRAERNEYLLLHAFYQRGFLCPDKRIINNPKKGFKKDSQTNEKHDPTLENLEEEDYHQDDGEEANQVHANTQGRRKPAYVGGLVLEPKRAIADDAEKNSDDATSGISGIPHVVESLEITESRKNQETGVLPAEIRRLVESRRQVKKLMKQQNFSEDQRAQFNIRQMALKLTANSLYGLLGFAFSRFFAKTLAALITAKGRETLQATVELVEKQFGLEVIYGDTDSIMINTRLNNFQDVMTLAQKIKIAVNKHYKSIELDVDGIYSRLLLLKKKKYAGMKIDGLADGNMKDHQEVKGLDLVRRDWALIAKESGFKVLGMILNAKMGIDEVIENIHEYLKQLANDVREGKISVAKFFIQKQLTKNPKEYHDAKGQPHVNVALRMNKKGGREFRSGDTIPYVICEDGTPNPATQRAYHPVELKQNKDLKIDNKYYLSQQIHPVVTRLLEVFEEQTSRGRIAECLGLDAGEYQTRSAAADSEDARELIDLPRIQIESAIKPEFKCPTCRNSMNTFHFGEKCPSCNAFLEESFHSKELKKQAMQQICFQSSKFEDRWMNCESCGHRIQQNVNEAMNIDFDGNIICPKCNESALKPERSMEQMTATIFKIESDVPQEICFEIRIPLKRKYLNNTDNYFDLGHMFN